MLKSLINMSELKIQMKSTQWNLIKHGNIHDNY